MKKKVNSKLPYLKEFMESKQDKDGEELRLKVKEVIKSAKKEQT